MKALKPIPKFKNEDEEAKFWGTHDSTDYVDWSKAEGVTFPNLKPTLKSINIRLPSSMINELKRLANKQDVPYQSLLKTFLTRQIALEKKPNPLRAIEDPNVQRNHHI